MKLKKKLLAAMAAFSLLSTLALPSFTAFAAEDNITQGGTLTITKKLELGENATVVPNTEFSFKIEPATNVEDMEEGGVPIKKDTPLKHATENDLKVKFTNQDQTTDEAGKKVATKTVTYNFSEAGNVTFDEKPAVYYYKVTETTGSTTGVTYDDTDYLLKVYVNENGTVNALVAYKLDEAGTKAQGAKVPLEFKNTYVAEKLTVDKTVAGVSKSDNDEFTFHLTVEESETLKANTVIKATKTVGTVKEEVDITVGIDSTFKLKGGQSITITDLPIGTNYTITEDNFSGYVKSVKVDGSTAVSEEQGKYKVVDNTNAVRFTNTNNTITPTGLIVTVAPYAAGLILVAGLGLLLVAKKRKVTE